MRQFKWIDWNLQKIDAHGLSAAEVEAAFDRILRLKGRGMVHSKWRQKRLPAVRFGSFGGMIGRGTRSLTYSGKPLTRPFLSSQRTDASDLR